MTREYKRHELTKATIQYDVSDLKKSIEANGQLQPALLWFDDKLGEWVLVDGWHRYLACTQLGIELVTAKLDHGVEEKKIPELILEIQILNKMCSGLQAACAAVVYLDMVAEYASKDKMSQRELAAKYGSKVSLTNLKRLVYIKKENPEWFSALSRGEKVDIEKDGEKYLTDSPKVIEEHLKKVKLIQEKIDQIEVKQVDRESNVYQIQMDEFMAELDPFLKTAVKKYGNCVIQDAYWKWNTENFDTGIDEELAHGSWCEEQQ
jgi:hypothetical protein